MAEGGIAAALANVDDRDNWKVHFADTMRGGQYVNNWRMAELHAKEAPERVRELEAWGALFDRTPDGRILQRNFGGHRYPAPGPRRRPHRPGDDPHAAGPRHPPGHRRPHGVHGRRACSRTARRVAGAFAYDRERGRFKVFQAKAVVLATGGIGRAYKITSNSWEYTGDGHALAYDAGAELIDMEFVQFHPTGMVWPPSVQGILVTEGVRGEGGVLLNKDGQALHVRRHPRELPRADRRQRGGGLALHAGRQERAPAARAAHPRPRGPLHRARGQGGRGSPHGGVFLDIAWIKERLPNAAEHIKKKLPSMYHQFKQLADIDITKEPMEVGPTTHYMMGGVRVDADTQMSTRARAVRGRRVRGGHPRRQPAGRQLALRPPGVRQARRRVRGEVRADTARPAVSTTRRSRRARASALAPFERARPAERPVPDPARAAGDDAGPGRHRAREDEMERALEQLAELKERAAPGRRRTGNREYNPGWHTALDLRNLLTVSEAITRAALERKESRGGHFRDDYPRQGPAASGRSTSSCARGGRLDAVGASRSRRCPPS